MDRLAELGKDMMGAVLDGLDAKTVERMIGELSHTKENLKREIARNFAAKVAAPLPENCHGGKSCRTEKDPRKNNSGGARRRASKARALAARLRMICSSSSR